MDNVLTTKELGQFGEEAVCEFLVNRGYKIIERNFRTPFGEIDIIAKKQGTIAIVEVKTRKASSSVFRPEDNITQRKQKKLIMLGNFYIASHEAYKDLKWEIDVAAVEVGEDMVPKIQFMRQAVTE